MKKILLVFLSVIMVIGMFSACSSDEVVSETTENAIYGKTTERAVETTEETTVSTAAGYTGEKIDWRSFTVTINGAEIQFPISYSEFSEKTGYVLFDDALVEDNPFNCLEPTQSKTSPMMRSDGGVENEDNLLVGFYNPTDEAVHYTDALIVGFSVSTLWYECPDIVFPGGLTYGDIVSEDMITVMFGEPDNTETESPGYRVLTWGAPGDKIVDYTRFVVDFGLHDNEISEIHYYCYDGV